jgi:hypothetical protein
MLADGFQRFVLEQALNLGLLSLSAFVRLLVPVKAFTAN